MKQNLHFLSFIPISSSIILDEAMISLAADEFSTLRTKSFTYEELAIISQIWRSSSFSFKCCLIVKVNKKGEALTPKAFASFWKLLALSLAIVRTLLRHTKESLLCLYLLVTEKPAKRLALYLLSHQISSFWNEGWHQTFLDSNLAPLALNRSAIFHSCPLMQHQKPLGVWFWPFHFYSHAMVRQITKLPFACLIWGYLLTNSLPFVFFYDIVISL